MVGLRLINRTGKPIEVTAHLRPAAGMGDASATRDLATAAATAPAHTETWVSFRFDARPDSPFVWVWLPKTEGLSWRLMETAPRGAGRGYRTGPDNTWTTIPGQYYAFQTVPTIRLKVSGFEPKNVIDGWTRKHDGAPHMWAGDPEQPLPQTLELRWAEPQTVNAVYLTFDTNLNTKRIVAPVPPECVRDYDIALYDGKTWTTVIEERGNFLRHRIHRFPERTIRRLRVVTHATNGVKEARIYEIRVYRE